MTPLVFDFASSSPPATMGHVSDGVMNAADKASQKSSFLQTCNLLSRYIKEKGSLRDLNLEIGGKVESLDAIVKPGSSLSASNSNSQGNHKKSAKQTLSEQQPFIDLSSQVSSPDSTSIISIEDSSNKTSTSKEGATTTTTEPKPSQLTIFYSGRVLVFDDFPADKARELVSIAKKSSSQMSYGTLPNAMPCLHSRKQPVGILSNTSSKEKSIPTINSFPAREGLPPRPQPAGGKDKAKANTVGSPEATASKAVQEQASPAESEANGSDLPIARRSSLHRFLEKRKDRAAARGPYQYQNQHHGGAPGSSSSSDKGDEPLDLNL